MIRGEVIDGGETQVIRGVVFDLGSTLIRFRGDWPSIYERGLKALVRSLHRSGYSVNGSSFAEGFRKQMQTAQLERRIEHRERTSASVVGELLVELGNSDVKSEHLALALAKMYAVSERYWEPMPGLQETLATLSGKGYRIGLISNASDAPNVWRLIDKAGIRSRVDPIVISAEVGVRKPAVGIFEIVLRSWGLPASEVVMVGDALEEDILGAKTAGMRQVWLKAEADSPANRDLAAEIAPDAIADDLGKVPAIIDALE